MEPGQVVRRARKKHGWSQRELAERTGVSQVAVQKIERGDTMKSKHLAKIAQVLGVPLESLDRSLSQNHPSESMGISSATKPSQSALHTIPRSELMGNVDLPVFAMVAGGKGAVILGNDPFTHIARPRRLIGRLHGYGVQVIGDSMAREFNEGDVAYVDPNLPPRKGDPCVFQGTRQDGTVEAIIKYLERSPDASETVFYVSESNPPRKFTIKKADWQKCHVAVGKESGR